MKEVTYEDYLEYIKKHKKITIEDQVISLEPVGITRLEPTSEELTDVTTTVWSFPKRGTWATHKGDYRGNWAPQIPRALMIMYSRPGEVILDQMVGSGTTCIEARLLGRNCVGVDINYNAVILTLHRLYYLEKYARDYTEKKLTLANYLGMKEKVITNILNSWSRIYHGDARNLNRIEDESVDLVATHPPYFNIIKYGKEGRVDGDLSKARSLEEYLKWMREVAKETYRVLKPGRYCAVLIGDTRVHKHYVPISHYVLQTFLSQGFILKEEVIKIQHKMRTTREIWSKLKERDFLLIYHEKLLIFRKPGKNEKISKYKYSIKPGFLEISL